MKAESNLTTFENWTLRVRPGTGKRILLLLHGWTGDQDSMSIFIRNFPSDCWIVLPRAPFATKPKGYSWRAPAPQGTWPTIELFRPSVKLLIDFLDHWAAANNLDASLVDVAGFSQGAALTFTIGALFPDRVRKMGILAGFVPEGAESILKSNSMTGKNIFISHGTQDEMVPIARAYETIKILENAGATVHFCQSDVGHKLSAECLKALEAYLVN